MKKTFIAMVAAATIFASVDMSAKGKTHRPHYGAHYETGMELSVGYLHSGYRSKSWVTDEVTKASGLNGLYVGLTKDMTIVRNTLYFQTGLLYEYQTSTNRYTADQNLPVVEEHNEHYVDVPLRLKLSMDVTSDMRAFIYLGPTLDFGVSAKVQGRVKVDDKVLKTNYNYFSGNINGDFLILGMPTSPYRAFDVLMGGAAGVELYDVAVVKIGFDFGLINKNKNEAVADQLTTHRNLFHLGVGVRF